MASVTLDRAFLSLAADPSKYVRVVTSDRAEVQAAPGEVRRMANGRLRVVSRAGNARTVGATLRTLSAADVATVRSWLGSVVLFRDVWGRKVYGAFFEVDVVDAKDRSGQDVKLTLAEVTFSEAVA